MAVVLYGKGDSDIRRWGKWDVIDTGDGFTVKRLTVLPGKSLSLQTHEFRSEHWVIAQGVATVTLGREVRRYEMDRHIYIPKGEFHRLSNNEEETLIVIEVQMGENLDENDIVRYDEKYRPLV